MKKQLRTIVSFVVCAFIMASCQKACGKKPETPAPTPEQKAAAQEKPQPPLANVNFDGLTEAQITSINKLFADEICPCGCPKTFAQCLNMKDGCKPATMLADWAIKQLKEGAPEHFLYRAISEEVSTGYLAPQKTIDTKNAHRKGRPDAPFVIVEFADFECPACKLASAEIKGFISDNKDDVQIYFMHFPLSTHPNAERAAIAAEAAGKQGKFWEMHDLLFAFAGQLTDKAIVELAKSVFNKTQFAQFEKDLHDPSLLKKIKEHKDYAMNTLNLAGTPTFMFNGRPYNLSSSKDGYQLRLSMEKARKEINCTAEAAPQK